MKPLLLFFVAALALASCQCQPVVPSPVTFRIENPLSIPIFVDATDGRMGLHLQRRVLGSWNEFVESPPCECLTCDRICGGCACAPRGLSQVVKISAGGSLEREWSGVVQVEGRASCSGSLVQGPSCLTPENPPVNETFRVELCFAPSAPGAEAADAGEPVPGLLPVPSTECVQREFQVQDEVVEISPRRGADCTTHAGCTQPGELCFAGTCTTSCPANGFPEVGSQWQVSVNIGSDTGFFTQTQTGGATVYDGTGTVGSVRYDNNVMRLQLKRPVESVPDKFYVASVNVILPSGAAVALSSGEAVSVKIIDASTDDLPGNEAITLRDSAGALLLAADAALVRPLLGSAELAPFSVERGDGPVGCRDSDCGKNLFFTTRFTAGGETADAAPGQSVDLVALDQSWRVVNVSNARYPEDTWCTLGGLMPYVVLNLRARP